MTDFLLSLTIEIKASLLLDCIEDRQTAEWSLEADNLVTNLYLWLTIYLYTNLLKKFLSERHHPVVILVLYIKLHTSKLWIMETVHTLVTEVLTDFIYTLETTNNQTLQIKLCCDTHVHINVESIEVSNEWARTCTTSNTLQGRSFYLCITSLIEELTHGTQYGSTLQEGIFHTLIHNEVNITLTITLLWVFKLIVCLTILILNNRQWLQALRQNGNLLSMNRDFSHLCLKHFTLHSDEVTNIEQLLEDLIIKFFILTRTDVVTSDINLDSTLAIL